MSPCRRPGGVEAVFGVQLTEMGFDVPSCYSGGRGSATVEVKRERSSRGPECDRGGSGSPDQQRPRVGAGELAALPRLADLHRGATVRQIPAKSAMPRS